MTNRFLAITFPILLLTYILCGAHNAYAQTSGSTGTIKEDASQAIPISPSIKNTATWQSMVQKGACKAVSVSTGGLVEIPSSDVLLSMGEGFVQGLGEGANNIYDCSRTAYEQVAGLATGTVDFLLNIVLKYLLFVLAAMVSLGIWLLRLAAYILTLMLGQGSFVTNDLVREAWPFVQGLANLGFIFALLYIAFATTLRLQSVSTSVQRLLPKLLIGALLVNFSLVIGGLLIDTSRLLMAVEFQILGGGTGSQVTVNNIAAKLLDTSNIYGTVFEKSTGIFANSNDQNANPLFVSVKKSDSWSLLIEAIQALIFVYAVAIGMVVIALGLFWRYIMLLLLLIASPIAYVAVALPQTKKWFDQWWSSFLKWVMYGPIMLFILILIVRVQAIAPVQVADGDNRTPIYESIIRLIVTVTLMIVAAKISSGSSGIFANSFMGMVNKTGAWAKKNPKMALALGSGGAALPLIGAVGAAQYGATAAKNNVKDFYGAASTNFMTKTRSGKLFGENSPGSSGPEGLNRLAQFIAGPERDEKGKLKKGQSSLLSPLGQKMFRSQDAIDASNAATVAVSNTAVNVTTQPALLPDKLMKKTTATALSKDQLKDLIPRMSEKQLKAVLSHSDVISKLDDKTKASLLNGEYGGKDHNITTTAGKQSHDNAAKEVAKMVDSRLRGLENAK